MNIHTVKEHQGRLGRRKGTTKTKASTLMMGRTELRDNEKKLREGSETGLKCALLKGQGKASCAEHE